MAISDHEGLTFYSGMENHSMVTDRQTEAHKQRMTHRAGSNPHNSQMLRGPDYRSSQIPTPGRAHTSSVDTHVPVLDRRRQWSCLLFLMTIARVFSRGAVLEENTFSRLHLRSLPLISPGRTHSFVDSSKDRGPEPLSSEASTCLPLNRDLGETFRPSG